MKFKFVVEPYTEEDGKRMIQLFNKLKIVHDYSGTSYRSKYDPKIDTIRRFYCVNDFVIIKPKKFLDPDDIILSVKDLEFFAEHGVFPQDAAKNRLAGIMISV